MLEHLLRSGNPFYVAPDGQMLVGASSPRGLLPGSFNPLHDAHLKLAEIAADILGHPVAFELSVANVDKPSLAASEIRQRLQQFAWRAPLWLTHAPRFVDKAEHFPRASFVVGADTALRIVSPRYYNHEEAQMRGALTRLLELECVFLVACRVDAGGQCIEPADLPIPSYCRELFRGISSAQFRWDLSSTELRARG